MEQVTFSMQARGQAIIGQKTDKLQQRLMSDMALQYENRMAQQTVEHMDQVALVVSIDPEPAISTG